MKKILSILLAVAVTISFMPATSFAAAKTSKGFPPGIRVEAKSTNVFGRVNHQDSDLESIRQQVMDMIDETYAESVFDEKYYAAPVFAEITQVYDQLAEKVGNAKKLDDLVQEGMFGYMLTDELAEEIEMIAYLGGLTKQNGIKGANALDKCISDLEQYKKTVFAQYKLSKYNNWYQDIISEFKSDINAEMNKLKKDPSFAGCAKVKAMIAVYDTDDEEYGDDDWIMIIGDDDEGDDNEFYLDEDKLVYTNEELTSNIEMMQSSLMSYVEEVLAKYAEENSLKETSTKYTQMSEKLTKYAEGFTKRAKKYPDIESIFAEYQASTWKLYEIAGLDDEGDNSMVEPSGSDLVRLMRGIEEIYMSYDLTKYSETQRGKMDELYYNYLYDYAYSFRYTKAEAKTMETRAAARAKYLKKVKAKFDKFPVKTVELKNKRTNLYNKLVKKYRTDGKKKYDQKKVSAQLKKAKAAMNKATEPEQVVEIYHEYVTKLNGTIKKFTVKTSKKGKGTITKTTKVKYGKNFTVKFTPKAGYKIKKITVDGKKLKKLKNKYTFKKVKKAHRIKVVFGK